MITENLKKSHPVSTDVSDKVFDSIHKRLTFESNLFCDIFRFDILLLIVDKDLSIWHLFPVHLLDPAFKLHLCQAPQEIREERAINLLVGDVHHMADVFKERNRGRLQRRLQQIITCMCINTHDTSRQI